MTPIPTVISMPAKTAAGIFDAIGPKARRINSNIRPETIPDNFVFPPELMLTTVLIVAPAPGSSHEVFFNYCFNIEVKPRINGSYRNPIFL